MESEYNILGAYKVVIIGMGDRGLVTRHHVTVTYSRIARRHKTYYLVALLVHPFGSMSRIKTITICQNSTESNYRLSLQNIFISF